MATTCFRCEQPENTVFYAADGTMRSAAPASAPAPAAGAPASAEVAGSDPKTVIPCALCTVRCAGDGDH